MIAFFTSLSECGLILEEPKQLEQTYEHDRRLTYESYPIVHNRDDKLDDE